MLDKVFFAVDAIGHLISFYFVFIREAFYFCEGWHSKDVRAG
uniref:Uncharacterized protein n=1 Tax=Arundo donax TaxID=35708 RepID=A0A0A8Z604_ARUDO